MSGMEDGNASMWESLFEVIPRWKLVTLLQTWGLDPKTAHSLALNLVSFAEAKFLLECLKKDGD